jgi:hypothetical protein
MRKMCLVCRRDIDSDGAWLFVSGGDHELGLTASVVVATVKYDGCRLLC